MRLSPGDPVPDFQLLDADEHEFSSMSLRGAPAILYFYPAALTPGCTKQACDFRDNLGVLRDADLTVVGISPDKPAKLRKFRETHDLPFTLLSDPDHVVMEAVGAWGEKTLYGKTVTGVIRSTIVVGASGLVEHAFYNVKATGHVAKLLRELKLAA
jgi:thioredoxin-dependent peroxiredoxin